MYLKSVLVKNYFQVMDSVVLRDNSAHSVHSNPDLCCKKTTVGKRY